MTTSIATYVGGPLDGQTIRRAPGGKWSLYRDDNGELISPRAGDAEWVRRRRRGLGEARRYYVRQDVNGVVTYLHATTWHLHATSHQ